MRSLRKGRQRDNRKVEPMMREQAEDLYDRGREATVEVLLELSSRVEEAEQRLLMRSTNSSSPAPSDPPSVEKPKAEKRSDFDLLDRLWRRKPSQ